MDISSIENIELCYHSLDDNYEELKEMKIDIYRDVPNTY